MSSKNRSLPGFTVVELLIVMLLSGIVVGLTYMYYTQFQSYMAKAYSESDIYTSSAMLYQVISRDIDEAGQVYFRPSSGIILRNKDNEIEYDFSEDWVIRSTESYSDTFRVKTSQPEVHELEDYKYLVDFISFDIYPGKDPSFGVCIRKNYLSKTLFENFQNDR